MWEKWSSSSSLDFSINLQVYSGTSTSEGPLPGSTLAAYMADLTPDLQVSLSWGLTAESLLSLQSLSVSCLQVIFGSQAHAYHQPVCQKLIWLHRWSGPCVHTSWTFSPSGWSPGIQCRAVQVAHWTWWWQCLVVLHCRSVWSLLCHFIAELEVWLCWWPSFTCMEHCPLHTRAVHKATCLEREVAGREN